MQALAQAARGVATLHAAGYVHRNVKPANIMWLPRDSRWALHDFGCSARAGSTAPLSFSLAYAAPEVVRASTARPTPGEVLVVPPVDAWSLGVVAYEVLTGERALMVTRNSRERIIQALRGERPLPWETEGGAAADPRLGALHGPVLGLLARDPNHRMTADAFAEQCEKIATLPPLED